MKKFFCILVSLLTLTTFTPNNISAAALSDYSKTEIIYQDEDITIETTLTIHANNTTGIQTFSTKKSTAATKTATIKSSSGKILATYKLKGTFTYNGKTASCTNAIYSTSIKNAKWSFSSKSARKSSNKAIGSYTLKHTNGTTKSGSVTLTCNKNGTIS